MLTPPSIGGYFPKMQIFMFALQSRILKFRICRGRLADLLTQKAALLRVIYRSGLRSGREGHFAQVIIQTTEITNGLIYDALYSRAAGDANIGHLSIVYII